MQRTVGFQGGGGGGVPLCPPPNGPNNIKNQTTLLNTYYRDHSLQCAFAQTQYSEIHAIGPLTFASTYVRNRTIVEQVRNTVKVSQQVAL